MQDDDTFDDRLFFGPMGPLVPVEFESTETGEPFLKCSSCTLLFSEMEQATCFIEKVMRSGECIVEVALCSDCLSNGRCDWSDESIESLEMHNLEHPLIPSGLGHCAGCQIEANIWTDDITYVGIIEKTVGLLGPPALICTDCLEQIESVLSEETRREMDEFADSVLPGVNAEGVPSSSLFVL